MKVPTSEINATPKNAKTAFFTLTLAASRRKYIDITVIDVFAFNKECIHILHSWL